jgi:hypothetical protein
MSVSKIINTLTSIDSTVHLDTNRSSLFPLVHVIVCEKGSMSELENILLFQSPMYLTFDLLNQISIGINIIPQVPVVHMIDMVKNKSWKSFYFNVHYLTFCPQKWKGIILPNGSSNIVIEDRILLCPI